MLKNKLVKASLISLTSLSCILLIIIIFQPTNVTVDEGYKSSYMTFFAWIGILLSLPIAVLMVKPVSDLDVNRFGQIMHQVGVWGTRFCIVFTFFLLFASGGYLIPKHIVDFNASEIFSETVVYNSYKLSSMPNSPPYAAGKFWIFNEYVLLIRGKKENLPLLINNWFGTNKLNYSAVENYLGRSGTRMKLNGRKHARGYTFDSLTLN